MKRTDILSDANCAITQDRAAAYGAAEDNFSAIADAWASEISYVQGPPGTGKTTLARLIAQVTRAHFISFSAVLAGIKEIKAVMAEAERAVAELGNLDEARGQIEDIKTTVEASRMTMMAKRSAQDELRREGEAACDDAVLEAAGITELPATIEDFEARFGASILARDRSERWTGVDRRDSDRILP